MTRRTHSIRLAALLGMGVLGGCLDLYDRYEGGIAPGGTARERHQWGVEKMGTTYLQSIEWVKNSGLVQADVGEISTIAPIGNNRLQLCLHGRM